jgi:hypothetical protein
MPLVAVRRVAIAGEAFERKRTGRARWIFSHQPNNAPPFLSSLVQLDPTRAPLAATSAATGASTASAAISKVPEGFQLYYVGTERSWTAARAALKFAKVTQDGDGEGFLKIDRLPTEAEGHIIRDELGIPKKRQSSEEEIARLRAASPIISPFRRQKPHFLAVRVGR